LAQRGESTDTTLARLQSATDTAPKAVKDKLATVPTVAKSIVAAASKAGL
jgi:hypothetical protein